MERGHEESYPDRRRNEPFPGARSLNDFGQLRRLGDHLMGIGAHPQAAKAYHKALVRFGDGNVAENSTASAHLHARMASALLSDDLPDDASPYTSEAVDLAQGDPYVRYVHAFQLHYERSDGPAMEALDSVALDPSLHPWTSVARAEFDPERVDASVLRGTLADAVSKEPMNGALHTRLSEACERTGHYIDALQHARVAAWLQPSLLRRWRRYGTVAVLANSFSEAAEAFEGAREVSPFDPRIDALVARAHLLSGDIDAAAASVLRGLRKNTQQRDCLAVLDQLMKYNPASVAPSLLRLELDMEATEDKEPFIFVPPWCGSVASQDT